MRPRADVGQNRSMSTQLSFRLGASPRDWLMIRMSTNPFAATGGPMPRITIPLEARLTGPGIQLEVLRFMFDLKLGNVLVGQGEIGPLTSLNMHDHYFPAVATCSRDALPLLFNPSPPQGRLTLELALGGFLRYRHSFQEGDGRAQGLDKPDIWHIESIGEQGIHRLEVQVARSDWYEQVVSHLGIGDFLVTPLYLPRGIPAWQAALNHLDQAARAITQADPPAVFGHCRAQGPGKVDVTVSDWRG